MRVFTEEQAAAVARREGPLLLSAAAGSGKTSVLVERFVRMVTDDGIAPGKVLVITFTEKAAGELRARIRAQLLELGHRELAQDAEGAWISTFHGFCARVLRSHAVAAGLDPAFVVLDEAGGRELREAAFERALAGLLGRPEDPPRPDALDLVAGYTPDRLKAMVLDVYAQLRSTGQSRPALPALPPAPDLAALRAALAAASAAAADCLASLDGSTVQRAQAAIARSAELLAHDGVPPFAALKAAVFAPGRTGALNADPCLAYLRALDDYTAAVEAAAGADAIALLDELLGRHADAYADAKRSRSAVDFDDLELMVAGLYDALPGLARSWAGRFDRIMVDEFQDTNAVQVALLARLDSGHTFRVGDEMQSIYGFRNASIEVFRAVRAELEELGAVSLLTSNFRTRDEILATINAAWAALADGFEPLVTGRQDAPAPEPVVELLLTDRSDGWDGVDLGALAAGQAWRCAEARMLGQRIAELVHGGVHKASDIVVLVRAATDIATYERAIEDHGISTLASGGRGFWARQQVQDLTQYLAALANPRDEAALLGVLASPLGPRLDSDALARLALEARRTGHGLWAAVEAEPALAAWTEAFAAERTRASRLTLAELLTRAVASSAYDEHVLRLPGGVRRMANVRKLIRLATAYERDVGRGVRGFIDRATAELEAEAREADAPIELSGFDAVRLMTIHAAKGLEFPVVAVADLGRDPNMSTPDILVDGDRIGLRLVTLGGKARTADYEALKDERQQRERAEALRVLYVALTRAQDRLIVSGAVNLEKWPTSVNAAPIAWLAPVLEAAGVVGVGNAPGNGALRPAGTAGAGEGGSVPASRIGRPTHRTPLDSSHPPAPPPVSALSYSALSSHAQCGYRFYLERVLRLPRQDPPPAPGQAAPTKLDPLVRGSIAHELLERLDLTSPRLPDAQAIEDIAKRHEATLTPADVADISALLDGALSSEVMARVAKAAERHVEEPFALALSGPEHSHIPLFTGFLDLRAVEHDGAALVLDYKTDRLDGADPETVVEHGYGVQRRLYALAALRAGAPSVDVVHLFLERSREPAVARYAAADIVRLETEIAARADDVLAGRFEVAEHPHRELCATCPGRGGLCSWPEETVLKPLAES